MSPNPNEDRRPKDTRPDKPKDDNDAAKLIREALKQREQHERAKGKDR